MQISELYRKSKMGEELKRFSKKMLNSQGTVSNDYGETFTFKQILCDKKSYSDNDLDVNRGITCGFSMDAYDIIVEFCVGYSRSIGHNISGQKLAKFSYDLGKNILNIDHNDVERLQNAINKSVDEYTAIPLSDILSCSDFIDVFNSPDNNKKGQLEDLLSQHTEMSYDDIKKAVDSALLSPENKKIVFAEVLPAYNFKVCNDFKATWDMFENGYIDFDTLVTKFWDRENFDQGQNNKDQQNVFRDFASKYTKYAGYKTDNMGASKSSTENMISGLRQKGVIAGNDTQDLKDQIDNAADVGVFGIIAQFFSNLFSKGKTAFKPIQQTKQDRVISNLKPLSGLLRQAAEEHMDGSDKLGSVHIK